MPRLRLALCALLFNASAYAINWEARITNTNTPLADAEIQAALSKGISDNFATLFPGRQYGISVLLDTQTVPSLNGDLVYMALGLSHRLPNGALELPVGRYSDVLVLPSGGTAEANKEAIAQRLTSVATSFSRAMMQNKAAFDHARSSAPASAEHWTEWPDYQPPASSAGTVSGGK